MPRTKQSERRWPPSITKEYYDFCIKQMPKGAIKADLTKHAPHNSYSPPMWYVDEHQKCVECRVKFTFTAKQQQHCCAATRLRHRSDTWWRWRSVHDIRTRRSFEGRQNEYFRSGIQQARCWATPVWRRHRI